MKDKLKVYIADDHTLFRKAMANLLRTFSKVELVRDAENGKELLNLMKVETPDVAIVDLQMPVMDGAETSENIIEKYPDVKIIILTMHDSERYILHMMEMGVHAFLMKNTEPQELEKAIDSVIQKDFYHNDLVAAVLRKNVKEKKSGLRPHFRNIDISEREKEIISLICMEYSSKEIGSKLNISERTVDAHRARIMEKLSIKSTVGIVRFAYENGLMT